MRLITTRVRRHALLVALAAVAAVPAMAPAIARANFLPEGTDHFGFCGLLPAPPAQAPLNWDCLSYPVWTTSNNQGEVVVWGMWNTGDPLWSAIALPDEITVYAWNGSAWVDDGTKTISPGSGAVMLAGVAAGTPIQITSTSPETFYLLF